jgi:hypothetical protein
MARGRLAVANRGFGRMLEHFQAKWTPVRVKKMRKNKNLEARFDSIKSGL